MSFASDLKRFSVKVEARNRRVFVGTVSEVTRSVVEGSVLTAAPGQPVDTGNLKASWHTSFDSPTQSTLSTNVVYAPAIEDGVGPYGPLTLRSSVGGWHSVKLTVAGFQRIVDKVTRDEGGGR